jgi:transposase
MRMDAVLPDRERLQCHEIQITDGQITIVVSGRSPIGQCPVCGQASARVHSRYARTLGDLPWQGLRVQVRWNSRKFFCQNGTCPRRIFTERLSDVAAPYGRKTQRLKLILSCLAFACGGEGGSRLAARLGIPASPDTLLRAISRSSIPDHPTPRVLGVDEWAFRRGQRYGTILCDLEQHRPVALLPDRSAESFAGWLREHPGVEIISRDRGDPFIKGAAAGAPGAVQVADRFHLVRNLRDALSRLIDRLSAQVTAAVRTINERKRTPPAPEAALPTPKGDGDLAPATTTFQARRQERRAQRVQRYEAVVDLHNQGVSLRDIARRMGLDRGTVGRYLRAGAFPERAHRGYRRGVDAHRDHLQRRWQAGCTNARLLFRELQDQGFTGSYYSVRRYVATWRNVRRAESRVPDPIRKPSSRCVAAWLLKPAAERSGEEQAFLDVLVEKCPVLKDAAEACGEFETLLRKRQCDVLDSWMEKATTGNAVPELRGFAEGLRDDLAAVRAAFTLPWSNGQVEGQVHRLKLIKRQMYGRAGFDLLQRRVPFSN